MSDYEVTLVNDNMQEFYVRFHGPTESELDWLLLGFDGEGGRGRRRQQELIVGWQAGVARRASLLYTSLVPWKPGSPLMLPT